MRKTISLVLVAAMILTTLLVMPTSAAAILDEHNVQIDAQYFGGNTEYKENYGKIGAIGWYEPVDIKTDGDASKGTLTIDGIVEDGEWTEKVYHIDSDYAANSGLPYGNNALFEVPSAENTFFRWLKDGNGKSMAPADGLEYDIRFMWDEHFFYLAVEYVDTDGYLNDGSAGDGSNWDGDAIQFRIDPNGPNAIVNGTGYDAAYDSFPYDPEIHGDTDTTLNCTYPWTNTSTEYSSYGEENHSSIGNFVFSYYTPDGYTDMCDASRRYFPTENEVEVELEDGTIGTKIETVYRPADISSYMEMVDEEYFAYASAYIYDTNPHPAFAEYEVCFEVALPWTLVSEDLYTPQAEDNLGFSFVRMNTAAGAGAYNSYLAWGSGVCGYETKDMPQVCGGSNCLVLSSVEAGDTVAHEHTFNEPTCINPETCDCGYERGFVAGHKYNYYNEVLPTGKNDGSILAHCPICDDSYTQTIASKEASVKYDFLTTDTTIQDQGWRSEGGFCIQWEDLDENGSRYTDETDPTGALRVKWWNKDGTPKNAFDNTTFGYAVADLTDDGQTGTYFDANSYEVSYSETMEVYFTSLPLTSEVDSDNPYNTYFGQWFGGESGVSYLGGLINVENQWFFTILPSTHQSPKTLEEFYENALSYTPATAEQIALNEWHDYAFMFDNDAEAAMLFWDGELVASATDYHFPTSRSDIQPIFIKHNAKAYVKNVEVGSTGLVALKTGWVNEEEEFVPPVVVPPVVGDTCTVSINGVESQVAAGTVINISADAFYAESAAYYRFSGWEGDIDGIADATAAETTLTVNGNVTITAGYLRIGDITSDGKINSTDSNMIKRIAAGKEALVPAADINNDGKINSTDSYLLASLITGTYKPVA